MFIRVKIDLTIFTFTSQHIFFHSFGFQVVFPGRVSRDSSVGVVTGYGLDGPGIKSRWWEGEIFRTCPDRLWGPPNLLYNGYRVFAGGKERPGRDADPSPPSSALGHERVELYFYFPYRPYGLSEPQCLYKGDLYLYLFPLEEAKWKKYCKSRTPCDFVYCLKQIIMEKKSKLL